MCKCVNVLMGSYANQTVKIVPWKKHLPHPRYFAGIDNCLLEEIEYLWNKGVKTDESCCGHNTAPPYISVKDESISLMLFLGYIHFQDPHMEFRNDIFKPKSE